MSYLKDREEAWIREQMKLDRNREQEIIDRLRSALDDIQTEIEANWVRYTKGQNIDMAEAKKRVNEMDVKRFARKAKKYVKEKNFSPQANYELKLYNLTMRLSRLELLKAQIGLELIACFDGLDKWGYGEISEAAKKEYERQAGILGATLGKDYTKAINQIIDASFKSSEFPSFSENIWQNFTEMKYDLEKIITRAITRGKNPKAVSNELAKFLKPNQENVRFKLNRLMVTEVANIQIDIQKVSYEDMGVEEYDYIAEPSACPVCSDLARKSPYKVKDMEKGVNAPTMHPFCKCSTAGKVNREEWERSLKERGL